MTNPASAEPPPAPATTAAAPVNPSSSAAAAAAAPRASAPPPPSSSKRERERGAAGAGGGNGGGGVQQQQTTNTTTTTASANAEVDSDGPFGRGKRRRGKQRPLTPEMAMRKEVHASAKRQDARGALAAFDAYLELLRSENERARAGGEKKVGEDEEEEGGPAPYYHSPLWQPDSSLVHLSSDVRNSLLYLCAGGDSWDSELAGPEAKARRRAASGSAVVLDGSTSTAAAAAAPAAAAAAPPSSSPPLPASELARRGREIFDRTTVCLADVERPLRQGASSDGGAAAAAAAANAAAPSASASASASFPAPSAAAQQLSGDGEMAYTALARMSARARDPRGSLEAAREAVARGYPPRLRCFSPAILAFSVEGDAKSAFGVEREAREEHGLEMTEPELAFLASAAAAANNGGGEEASAASRVPFETVESAVLAVLTREHGRLQRETIAALEAYFASLGSGGGPEEEEEKKRWRVGRARVNPVTGRVRVCSVSSDDSNPATASSSFTEDALGPVDLEQHEWSAFSEGVAALARNRERSPPGAFDAFAEWCAANGPFDAVVDGANVALFGQNWSHGDFSFAQLEAVVEELKLRLGPGSKTLVVLHRSRLVAPPARDADGRRVLRSFASEAIALPAPSASSFPLPAQAMLYAAPHGSNDDWYWLHAAVAAGSKGLLVSNDEMRDHVFQLLSPRFAARWKDRHQVKYSFYGNYHLGSAALYNNNGYGNGNNGNSNSGVSAKLILPPPFSECSQRLPGTGAWLFPRAVASSAAAGEGGAEEGKREKKSGVGEDKDSDPDEWLCCSPVA